MKLKQIIIQDVNIVTLFQVVYGISFNLIYKANINDFQDKNVEQYYCNLITDFLNTEFHWNNGPPKDYSYRYVRDLPDDMKAQAVDCLGTILGWGPTYPGDGYVSNAYHIFQKYFVK